jgi:hypothetical protein
MSRKSITELTQSQIDYISRISNNAVKYANNNECIINHEYGNTWSVNVKNIKSNRFYLHYFPTKEFILECMDVNDNSITFQFELTRTFFKVH